MNARVRNRTLKEYARKEVEVSARVRPVYPPSVHASLKISSHISGGTQARLNMTMAEARGTDVWVSCEALGDDRHAVHLM